MAIKAITHTLLQNNINFAGAEKKKNKQSQTSSHSAPIYKSVPLAVLIAMSPLSANADENNRIEKENNPIEVVATPNVEDTQQSGKILASKKFVAKTYAPYTTVDGFDAFPEDVEVRLIDNNGKKSIDLQYKWYNHLVHTDDITLINNNISLRSSDESLGQVFSYKSLQCSPPPNTRIDEKIYYEPDLIKYVEKLGKKYPEALKIKTQNTDRYPTTMNKQNGWLTPRAFYKLKDAVEPESYGQQVYADFFGTKIGNYDLCQYFNDNKYIITIKKEGYPELKVNKVDYIKATFTNTLDEFNLPIIELIDAKNNRFVLLDDTIAEILTRIKSNPTSNEPYPVTYSKVSYRSQSGSGLTVH